MNDVVVGKRIPLGAALHSTALVFAGFYPDYAAQILASAIPLTFALQVAWVNMIGVTTK